MRTERCAPLARAASFLLGSCDLFKILLGNRVQQRRRWESNPLGPGCSRLPGRLAPASNTKCPRQGSNLVFDLRGVACDPAHSEDSLYSRFQYSAEELNPVLQIRSLPCCPAHSQGKSLAVFRPGLEPGSGPSEGPMLSATPSGQVQRPDQESNLDQDLRRVLCVPLHHRDNPHLEPTAGFAPASTGLQNRCLTARPRRQLCSRPAGRERVL